MFLSATPKVWKEPIGFTDPELYAESFEKNSLKKSNIQEAQQTLKIIRFLPIPDAVTGQKNLSQLSQRERFLEPI